LPGGIYTAGYIKTYASFLGINANLLCDIYNEMDEQDSSMPIAITHKSKKQTRRNPSPSKLLVTLSLVMAILLTIYSNYIPKEEIVAPAPSLSEKLFDLYTKNEHQITLLANKQVRVLLKDNNKTSSIDGKPEILFNSIMRKGDVYSFQLNDGNIFLDTSDISAIDIFVEDQMVADIDSMANASDGMLLNINSLLSKIEVE